MATDTTVIRVLYVNSDPAVTETAVTALESADAPITVQVAETASAAIDRLGDADCLVSGDEVPDSDAIAFLEAVHEQRPWLPVVVQASDGSEAFASRAISAGVAEYLRVEDGGDRLAAVVQDVTSSGSAGPRLAPTRPVSRESSVAGRTQPGRRASPERTNGQQSGERPDSQRANGGRSADDEGTNGQRSGSEPVEDSADGEGTTDRRPTEPFTEGELTEFARIVSHDLRNPLGVAAGWLDAIRVECDADEPDVDRIREAVERIETTHDRMDRLVEDVLALVRGGETTIEPEAVDFAVVARSCWATVAGEDAELVVAEGGRIRADPSRLRQLLENLLSNAVEHGGRVVTVGTTAEGFFVADDGPGIPASDRERVFDSGYSGPDGGTGLGLSIVDRVADAHGWRVRVGSGADGGARFDVTGVVTDPVERAHAADTRAESHEQHDSVDTVSDGGERD